MKDPEESKTRLGDTLPPKTRAALARSLFRQTLGVLRGLDHGLHIAVVTSSPSIEALCHPYRANPVADRGDGLNAAVAAGAAYAAHHRFEAMCVLPGDLAEPDPKDLLALFSTPRANRSVTIAPAHDGGTNALLVTPPDAMTFAFGPGSCAAHQRIAEEAGLACLVKPLPSLLYDVDRSADLGERLNRGLDRLLGAFG